MFATVEALMEIQEPASLFAVVADELAKYPPITTDDHCVEFCNLIAWKYRADGWGLSRKVGGQRGRRYDGQECAHDILHHRPSNLLFDVLVNAPHHPKAAWQNQGEPKSDDRTWVAPIPPDAFINFPPTPAAPASPTLQELMNAIRDLHQRLDALDVLAHNARMTAEGVQRLEAHVHAGIPVRLRARLIGEVTGTVGGVKP